MTKAYSSSLQARPDLLTMVWLVVALSLVLAPHLPRLPAWFVLLFAGAAGERLSHFYIRRKAFPGWLRMGLTLGSIIGILFTYGTLLGRQPGVTLLCVMLALKLLESYQRRDAYLLITLAYFVVVTQFLYSQSIYMVIYLLLTVVFITGTLIVVEVQPSRERHTDGPRISGGLLSHMKNAGWMLVQGVPLMIFMFMLFPRLSSPLWGLPEDALDGKTGISGDMSPGLISELFIDDSPAFRVRFESAVPRPQDMYWRGPVLWDFDGLTWTRPGMPLRSPAKVRSEDVGRPIAYSVTMQPTQRHWLFGLDLPLVSPAKGGLQLDHTLYSRAPIIDLKTYDMRSDPNYVVDPELSIYRRRAALALPPNRNPRTRSLAQQWREEAGDDDQALVQRALRMFYSEGFEYSFEPPPLGINTVDDFLFETRNGYCEYYSSAFTVLMRSAGIPARVVTGYQGGYLNREAGYVLVRNSDAHAWSEVWLKDRGWVRIDPTAAVAPDRIRLGAMAAFPLGRGALDFGWLRDFRNRLDGIHSLWNQWVVDFNKARQKSMLKPLGIDDFDERYATAALLLVCMGFVGFVMKLLWRAQWLGGLDPAAREYARFCRRLERAGLKRQPIEGPRDFGHRASRRFTAVGGQIEAITRLYIAQRYAGRGSEQRLLRLRQLVKAFRPRRLPAR